MNYLGVVLLFVVVSLTSSQLTYKSTPLKKLISTFDQTRSNFNRGQDRYQYNPYSDDGGDYYSPRSRGQYRSRYNSNNGNDYYNDNSGQYVPDDSGRYVHVDQKYQHLDIAGEGYRHLDGGIEKYRPDYSSDGYKGDYEKYKGDGGYKGDPDKYDVGGYKGDYEKYKGDGGYKGYKDKFDNDGYKGDKDKQIPYKDNKNSGVGGGRNNKGLGSDRRGPSDIDGIGGQGAGSSNSDRFSGISDGRILNKGGNANSNQFANAKHGSDICDYNSPKNFKIIRQKSDLGIDQYHYLYETENCMYKEEKGVHVQVNKEDTLKAEGIYYYVAPNNVKYTTTYTADERGYLPSGEHIPEMPPLILKGLQYLKSIGKL